MNRPMTHQYCIPEVHLRKINSDKCFPLAKAAYYVCTIQTAFKNISDFLTNVLFECEILKQLVFWKSHNFASPTPWKGTLSELGNLGERPSGR